MTRALAFLVLSSCVWGAVAQDQADRTYTDDGAFQEAILSVANRIRNEHGVSALTWNNTLADQALAWARQCRWRYSRSPSGETLAMLFPNAGAAVESWGAQRNIYNFNEPRFSFRTNHFTQLVWGNTDTIGCARYDCGPPSPEDRAYINRGPNRDKNDGYHDDYDDEDDRNDKEDDDDNDSGDDEDAPDDHLDDKPDDNHDDNGEGKGEDDEHPDDNEGGDNHDDAVTRRDDPDPDHDHDYDDCRDDDGDHHGPDGCLGDDDEAGPARGWFVVCQYSPPGNVLGTGEFAANVHPAGQGSNGGNNGGNNNGGNNGNGGQNGGSGANRLNGQNLNNSAVSYGSVKVFPLLGALGVAIGMM